MAIAQVRMWRSSEATDRLSRAARAAATFPLASASSPAFSRATDSREAPGTSRSCLPTEAVVPPSRASIAACGLAFGAGA